MAINSTFYLNAADFTLATAVYLDSSLANIAPDGFYGNGTITRQQSSGILLAAEDCVGCGVEVSLCAGTSAVDVCCNCDGIPLAWSFNEISGTGEMTLYVNEIAVETRTASDVGTYLVNVGDLIQVYVTTAGCTSPNIKAVSSASGIITGLVCTDFSSGYSSSGYYVVSGDLGTTLTLDTYSQCGDVCPA